MLHHIQKRGHSFRHALDGLTWAVTTQPNFKIHLVFSFVAIMLGSYFSITRHDWIYVVVVIVMGLVIELINTAIEAATDAITKEWRQEIKIAKDVAASAMLVYAIGALIIALLVFGPYFII